MRGCRAKGIDFLEIRVSYRPEGLQTCRKRKIHELTSFAMMFEGRSANRRSITKDAIIPP